MFSFYFNCMYIRSVMNKIFGAYNTPSKLDFRKIAVTKFNKAKNEINIFKSKDLVQEWNKSIIFL